MKNEIMEEVRANRSAMLEEYGGNLDSLFDNLIKKQGERGPQLIQIVEKPRKAAKLRNPYRR